MSPSSVLQIAMAVVTVGAAVMLGIGLVQRWRALIVNAAISTGFLLFFWVVVWVSDLEEDLSNVGLAIITGVAVAGIAEFANALRILVEGDRPA